MSTLDYFEPWLLLRQPLVRQLAFAIASPNLLHHFPTTISVFKNIQFHSQHHWQNYYQHYHSRLLALDANPMELQLFLTRIKSTRLGLRFEGLLWFWLQDPANPDFELLGHSIQYHHRGKTLGEIDFLIKNKHTQQIEHWEVCLKYYLAEPDLALDRWMGLNPEDTLQHKLMHLADRHFQFDQALGFDIEQRFAIMKGQLYLPVDHAYLPDWLNPQRRLGLWQNNIPKTGQWQRLQRQEWLCPLASTTTSSAPRLTWWNNGLYYDAQQQQFLMLKLKPYQLYLK